jgi:thiamine-phosphate pyrophosphorylase
MKLVAISSPAFIPEEAELINSLFREGLMCLHIRKPESSREECRTLIKKIKPQFSDRISIHQHHDLAGELGIKRLHFTEKERKATSAEILQNLISDQFLLSTSIHDLADTYHLSPYFRYTFFGPVFNSISKSGYKGVLSDDFYIKPENKQIPIIGLGGISIDNLEKVYAMNFDGAAVLGTLWKNPDHTVEAFRKMDALRFITSGHLNINQKR